MKMIKEDLIDILQEIMILTNRKHQERCYYALKHAIDFIEAIPCTPDWSQAPNWAKWCAISDNGIADWFEEKPYKIQGTYCRPIVSRYAQAPLMIKDKNKQELFKRPE